MVSDSHVSKQLSGFTPEMMMKTAEIHNQGIKG